MIKVGDEVILIQSVPPVFQHERGVVKDLTETYLIGVEWKRECDAFHNLNGTCQDLHGYYVPKDCLEVVDNSDIMMKMAQAIVDNYEKYDERDAVAYSCIFCGNSSNIHNGIEHEPDCIVNKAMGYLNENL